jgi:hypothetical protein
MFISTYMHVQANVSYTNQHVSIFFSKLFLFKTYEISTGLRVKDAEDKINFPINRLLPNIGTKNI